MKYEITWKRFNGDIIIEAHHKAISAGFECRHPVSGNVLKTVVSCKKSKRVREA